MSRRANELARINLYFQPRVMEALKRLALAKGSNVSELVRTACREYVVREGGKLVQESTVIKDLTS